MELAVSADDDLVRRVRAGDQAAFDDLARRHHAWLVRTCRPLLHGDHHHAEDLAQECLVRLHATVVRDDRPLAVRPWLSVVARNLCIDHLRRRTPEPVEDVPDVAAGDDDPFDIDPALATAWSRLQHRQREVLHHRELTGLSYDEIATVMGTSVSAVETLLFRARAALRREYQRAGGRMLGCGAFLFGLDRLARGHTAVPEAVAHISTCTACSRAVRDMEQIAELLRVGTTTPPPPRTPVSEWVTRAVEHLAQHVAHVGGLVDPVTSVVMAAAITLAPTAVARPVTHEPPTTHPVRSTGTHPTLPVAAVPLARPTSALVPTPASPSPTPRMWRWPTGGEPTSSPHPRPSWGPLLPWPSPSPGQAWPWPTPSTLGPPR